MTGILCANTYLQADGTHYSLVMLSVVIIKGTIYELTLILF